MPPDVQPHPSTVAVAEATPREVAPSPELVARVASVASIETVLLKELRCRRADAVPSGSIAASYEAFAASSVRDGLLYVNIKLRLHTQPEAFSVEAIFNLHYRLAEPRSQEEVDAFARTNALFNVWPYWRELVANSVDRMGVKIPPVPLLHALDTTREAERSGDSVLSVQASAGTKPRARPRHARRPQPRR